MATTEQEAGFVCNVTMHGKPWKVYALAAAAELRAAGDELNRIYAGPTSLALARRVEQLEAAIWRMASSCYHQAGSDVIGLVVEEATALGVWSDADHDREEGVHQDTHEAVQAFLADDGQPTEREEWRDFDPAC
jgi:hypothetical protein